MAYGMDFLGNVGQGLMDFGGTAMDFAKDNPALTGSLVGAGTGYLMDGKGGALAGGLLGGALGSGAEGLFGSGADTASTNVYGQGSKKMFDTAGLYSPANQSVIERAAATSAGLGGYGEALAPMGGSSVSTGASGLFGSGFSDRIRPMTDVAKTYGDITGGMATRENMQSEIDYRNRVAALNERDANLRYENQMATNQAAIDAFSKSKLSNYYSA